jgi:hypothetical protein
MAAGRRLRPSMSCSREGSRSCLPKLRYGNVQDDTDRPAAQDRLGLGIIGGQGGCMGM